MNDYPSIPEIRAAYPEPIKSGWGGGGAGTYCVGGAFCLATGRDLPFPSDSELSQHMRTLQPSMDGYAAFLHARAIIIANDDGNFDEAWASLAQALAGAQV